MAKKAGLQAGLIVSVVVDVDATGREYCRWMPSVDPNDRELGGNFQFTSISIGLIVAGAWPLACLAAPLIAAFDVKWWLESRRCRKTIKEAEESLSKGSWHWFNRKSARSVFPASDDTVADWSDRSFFRKPSIRPSDYFYSARQAFSEAESIAWRYGQDIPSPWRDE